MHFAARWALLQKTGLLDKKGENTQPGPGAGARHGLRSAGVGGVTMLEEQC